MPLPKILYLLLFCSPLCYGQSVEFKGKVTDADGTPLESATIYLKTVKDSLVLDYTITDSKGNWEIKIPKLKDTLTFTISYVGKTAYREKLPPGAPGRDFGTIKLEDQPTELDEILIESEAPPVRFKNDTLEFNASSFKVRDDANVEELIKRLPGVSIGQGGVISFNGKQVNQVLVDGKPFFGTDGAVALKDLPAEFIDKVQVTDLKTKEEELTGQKAKGDSASLNLTLKKDKKKGIFGKGGGGYGTNNRYESGVFANYFNDKQRVSLTASSNNINAFGFSLDDASGGRGGIRAMSGAIGGLGGGSGLSVSTSAGVNYTDEFVKDLETTLGYHYSSSDNENRNRSETINYLPEETDPETGQLVDRTYQSNSASASNGTNYSHNFSGDMRFKADSLTTITYMPQYDFSNSSNTSSSQSSSQRLADGALLNESTSQSTGVSNNNTLIGTFNFYRKSATKKGRGISAVLTHNNRSTASQNLNRSNTIAYTYNDGGVQESTDNRNQILNNDNSSNLYLLKLQYLEPVTDLLKLTVSAALTSNKSVNGRQSYDFDSATGGYTIFNDSLSNYQASTTLSATPQIGLMLDKNKVSFSLEGGLRFSGFNNHSVYIGQGFNFNKNYLLPSANMRASYKFEKFKVLDFNYGYIADFPQAQQVLPIKDLSNPLNTFVGNPDLDPNTSHNFRVNYRNFGNGQKAGYSILGGITLHGNQVVQYTTVNASAETETSYRNISGAMNANLGLNWNKFIRKDAYTLSLNFNIYGNYGTNNGYLNGQEYNSKSLLVVPSAFISYNYGELLDITHSYSFSYNEFNYQNYSVNGVSSYMHRASLQTTTYWPKHLVFSNDFSYSYNPQMSGGFSKDFYFWNAGIGYKMYDDKLVLRLKVYDVLNQNKGIQRTVSPTMTVDMENLVLKRYVMFTLAYKLDDF